MPVQMTMVEVPTAAEMTAAMAERDARIAALEADLAAALKKLNNHGGRLQKLEAARAK